MESALLCLLSIPVHPTLVWEKDCPLIQHNIHVRQIKQKKNGTAKRKILQTQICQSTNYDDELPWGRYPNDR